MGNVLAITCVTRIWIDTQQPELPVVEEQTIRYTIPPFMLLNVSLYIVAALLLWNAMYLSTINMYLQNSLIYSQLSTLTRKKSYYSFKKSPSLVC